MEITKEMIECVYAHIPPLRGLLVPVEDFCLKAEELYPGCGLNADNLVPTLEELYTNLRFITDYRENPDETPRAVFRLNNNRIPAVVDMRMGLQEGMRRAAAADGWADPEAAVAAVPGLGDKIARLGLRMPLEPFEVQPKLYLIGEDGRVRFAKVIDPEPQPAAAPDSGRLSALIDASIRQCAMADGWALMAKVAAHPEIRKELQEMGLRFKNAVETHFADRYEIGETLPGKENTAMTVRLRPGVAPVEGIMPEKPKKNENKPKSAFDKLTEFGLFLKYNEAIERLANKALPEKWHYGAQGVDSNKILKSYFEITFERLRYEDAVNRTNSAWSPKIRQSADGEYAIFNTGLVDKYYDPIYAFFRRNNNEKRDQKWFFLDFVCETDPLYLQQVARVFGANLPAPASYYSDSIQLIYNTDWSISAYDWEHILQERCYRFPTDLLRDVIPGFDTLKRPNGTTDFAAVAACIRDDTSVMIRMRNRVLDAVNLALKRVKWNFRTAVPIYYPKRHIISLLLPLSLTRSTHREADLALVVEATEAGAYIAHTVLTLEQAYTDARLITRLDAGWL